MNKFKKALIFLVTAVTVASNAMGLAACFGGGDSSSDASSSVSTSNGSSSSVSTSNSSSSSANTSVDSSTSTPDSVENSTSSSELPTDSSVDTSADSSVDTPASNITPYDGSKVTISFQHTMGAKLRTVLEAAIKEFNEIYPNITVTHTYPTSDYDELRNQLFMKVSTRNTPSMAFCYPDHVALYNTMVNTVVPLNDYANSTATVGNGEIMGLTQAQKDDYIKAFYDEGSCYGDDTMYTLPFLKSTEVLYYNKTYFRENNLPLLDELEAPISWTQMGELCQEIIDIEVAKAGSTKIKVTPLGYDSEANWFITMTEQYGSEYISATGEKFRFNNETNRTFVENFRTWFKSGYFTTKDLNGGTYTSNLFNTTAADQYKCYMCIGSTGGSSYQAPAPVNNKDPFEVGVAPIPQVDPANPKVIQQGPSVCLFQKDNPQEVAAAWLFAKFCTTSVNFQAEASIANGYTPVIKSVQENDYYKNTFLASATSTSNADLQAKTVKLALAQADAYYVSPAFDGSSSARDSLGILMRNCLAGNPKKGQSAADFIASKFQESVDSLNKKYP